MLSEVFEKLAKWRASPKIGQEGQVDEIHGWRDPVQLREDEVDVVLSALKTLRGIEGLAKRLTGVHIYIRDNECFVGGGMDVTESTLSLAVDAAVGAKPQ